MKLFVALALVCLLPAVFAADTVPDGVVVPSWMCVPPEKTDIMQIPVSLECDVLTAVTVNCAYENATNLIADINAYGDANGLGDILDGVYLPGHWEMMSLLLCHTEGSIQIGSITSMRTDGLQSDLDAYFTELESLLDPSWGQFRVRNKNYVNMGATGEGEMYVMEYINLEAWTTLLKGGYDTDDMSFATAHSKLIAACDGVELFAANTLAESEPRVAGSYVANNPIDFATEAATFCAKTPDMPCSTVEAIIADDDGLPYMMLGLVEYYDVAQYTAATYMPYDEDHPELCMPHKCACENAGNCTLNPGCGWWDDKCQVVCSETNCEQCIDEWWCSWEQEQDNSGCQWLVSQQSCASGRTGQDANVRFVVAMGGLLEERFKGFAYARTGGDVYLNLIGTMFDTTAAYSVVQFPSRREWFENMIWAPQSVDVFIHQSAATSVNDAAAQTPITFYTFTPWDQAGVIHERTGENCGYVVCDYDSAKISQETVVNIGCDTQLEKGQCADKCATELCNLWACADNPPVWLEHNHNAYAEIVYFSDLTKEAFGLTCAVADDLEPWAAASSLSPMLSLMGALIVGTFLLF